MKKFLFLTLLLSGWSGLCQQTRIYNQYLNNPFLYNPALAGSSGMTRAFAVYRNQWVGVPGAPQTQTLTLDGAVNDQVGLGLILFNDVDNILGRTGASLAYAYKIPIAKADHHLALGLSLGVLQTSIYFDRVLADDVSDPTLLGVMDNRASVDGTFGLNYHYKRLDVGLVSQQLFENKITFRNESTFRSLTYRLIRHYLGTIKYRFTLKPEVLDLETFLLVRTAQGLPPQVEGSVMLNYQSRQWIGLGYRHNSSAAFSLGTRVYDHFSIGYAYEISTTKFYNYNDGTHEVMISYRFGQPSKPVTTSADKDMSQLVLQNQYQYERLDQLEQEKERLEKEIKSNEETIARQSSELEELLHVIEQDKEAIEAMVARTATDLENESYEGEPATFYVVVGAFHLLKTAKLHQRVLAREVDMRTSVIRSDNDFFLVYTLSTKDQSEAINEISRIRSLDDKGLIIGNPWFYSVPDK